MDAKTNEHVEEKGNRQRSAAQILAAETDPLETDAGKKDDKAAADEKKNGKQPAPAHPWRKWLLLGGAILIAIIAAIFLTPWLITVINTVSTDDAYVNGHVTFVAPRVAGQVAKCWWKTTTASKKATFWSDWTQSPIAWKLTSNGRRGIRPRRT